jgi:hypothetical protein
MRGAGLTGRRRVVATAAMLAAAAGVVVWLYTLPSSADGLSMGDYGPAKQRDWAQQLVAGLNTRDALRVPVLRPSGMLPGAQASTIAAAMPAPGCRYELVSVRDRGVQGRQSTPGLGGENLTYRFDMAVDQHCPAGPSRPRTLRVMAVAEMGYWAPFYFGAD